MIYGVLVLVVFLSIFFIVWMRNNDIYYIDSFIIKQKQIDDLYSKIILQSERITSLQLEHDLLMKRLGLHYEAEKKIETSRTEPAKIITEKQHKENLKKEQSKNNSEFMFKSYANAYLQKTESLARQQQSYGGYK